jgi:ferredoxin
MYAVVLLGILITLACVATAQGVPPASVAGVVSVNGVPTDGVSVSGGGEIAPNTACRTHCIRRLERKGYPVIYERMLVMPSNVFTPTPPALTARLLEVLPAKADRIANDLLSGVVKRTRPGVLDRMLSVLGELEKPGGRYLGKGIKAGPACNGCGLCERSCPRSNIRMEDGRPAYGFRCVICLKCLYSCPVKALRLPFHRIFLIKGGFDLSAVADTSQRDESLPTEKTGWAMSGVVKYLREEE